MLDQIKIIIVDDHEVVREGYSYMLKAFEDIELIASVASLEETVDVCKSSKPHLILVDMYLQNMSGIDLITVIKEQFKSIHVIAITSYENDPTLVRKALKAGVKGFVYKTLAIDELAEAIRKVANGEYYLESNATENLILSLSDPKKLPLDLTQREHDVLNALRDGLSNRELADVLGVSINTIRSHMRNLMRKFNTSSRKEVIHIATQQGIFDKKD